MKKTMNNTLFVSLLMLLFSCNATRTGSTAEYHTVSKDSVKTVVQIVKERYDSIVFTPADTITITLDNPCDSLGNLKPLNINVSKGSSGTKVWTENGKLNVQTNCAEQLNRLQVEKNQTDSMNSILKQKLSDSYKSETKEEIEYRVPFWVWLIVGAEAAVIIYLGIKNII